MILLINLVWDYPHNELLLTLGTAVKDMISSVYNFLVLKFFTQGFLWGVLLCLKIGSWKEMDRVIFL